MAEFPALPLWTDAYLADTFDLSFEEHGAYLLMLFIAWRRPEQSLPGSLSAIKRLLGSAATGMHGNRFNRVVPGLLERFFFIGVDFNYHHKRLIKERDFLRNRSEKQRENVKKRYVDSNKNNDLVDPPKESGTTSHLTHSPQREERESVVTLPRPSAPEEAGKPKNKTLPAAKFDDDLLEVCKMTYNRMATQFSLPQCSVLSVKRKQQLRARLDDCGGLAGWKAALAKISASPFLKGEMGEWKCNFDFVLSPSGFQKIMEGNYDDKGPAKSAGKSGAKTHSVDRAYAELMADITEHRRREDEQGAGGSGDAPGDDIV